MILEGSQVVLPKPNRDHGKQHPANDAVKDLATVLEQFCMKKQPAAVADEVDRKQPELPIPMEIHSVGKQHHNLERGQQDPKREQTVPQSLPCDPTSSDRYNQGRA